MRIGIIGAGCMGRAIAHRAALSGAAVLLADRSSGKARRAAAEAMAGTSGRVTPTTVAAALRPGLVMLALDHDEALELATAHAATLTGKVLVDMSVPTRPDPAVSALEKLSHAVPEARWVKAFATADAEAVFMGEVDGQVVDVFVASDDDHAKVDVVEFVDRSGLRAFDAGGTDSARALEEMARLGREISERLMLARSWSYKLLPGW
ncbi:NADPH-dependent F420 reductase [Streptomyces sp. NPDC096176]|uniref:NADPH-dependent F420 reductase n=1 Tax=Streptomyces sp. NPDC096176 TaxID=3366079 RepID=UPI0037F5693C